jgi:aerobic carbon-monoxide dehydrogenase large subunit
MSAGASPPLRYTGRRIKRLEDPRLLTGRGRYLDDLGLPHMLFASFVRSPHAHARIVRIDAAAARAWPGVAAVITADDLRAVTRPLSPRVEGPGYTPTAWPALADGVASFCGEAVAAVVAVNPYVAADARELVTVEWEARPAVTTIDQALESNRILFQRRHRQGDVDGAFAGAPIVLRQTFEHGRCAPSPLELRGILADWDGEALTVWSPHQAPSLLRTALADALDLPHARIRIISPDVGGGFGLKMQVFPEDVAVAALSRRLGRPVKWLEERRENLVAASQARGQRTTVEVAAAADGTVLALRSRVMSDNGAYHAYPTTGVLEPLGTASIMPGPYRISACEFEALALATHKPPLGAYRGVGMTMGAFVAERMLDLLAERLSLDPAEIRRRNLIPREAYPFTSATGYTYDSGDFPKALEEVLAAVEYDKLRHEQQAARAAGRLVGIGIACYTEYTGMGSAGFRRRGAVEIPGIEAATVTMDADATARCAVSFPTQGQGHATTIAQLVAERLGLTLEDVRLQRVDTAESPRGSGTFASRGTVAMLGSAAVAADRVGEKLRALAAHRLEAAAADVELTGGRAYVRGFPDRSIALAEIARIAYSPPRGGLPDGLAPGLQATVYCDLPGPTFSGAVHVAVVEIDPATGRVTVRRYALVEDCGRVINPVIVEGQIHGAVAQGIGEALLESVVHDDNGQLLTATLMDYALPRADDLPLLEIVHLETPSPVTPGGVKGMGEGGTIGAPATIANAVADAVRHLGVQITSLPIRPESLLGGSATGRSGRT